MQYFEDMTTKYGFDDGSTIPEGIKKYREVYMEAINALAEARNCPIRAYPFDRSGMHNWCMIAFLPADVAATKPNNEDVNTMLANAEIDLGKDSDMRQIMEDCMLLRLDQYLCATIEIDENEFADVLENIEELVEKEKGANVSSEG